jgi:hypothetical protein
MYIKGRNSKKGTNSDHGVPGQYIYVLTKSYPNLVYKP